MGNEGADSGIPPVFNSTGELIRKNITIRSILPSDDPNVLWDISVRAMQSADPRFTGTRNPTHIDFNNPYKFYKQDHRGDLLIAEINSKIVGFAGFVEDADAHDSTVCEMRRLRVDPDYQRMEIGQKLITEREKRAVQMGYRTANVLTSNRNPAALHLLQKNGYRISQEIPAPDRGLGPDFVNYRLGKSLS